MDIFTKEVQLREPLLRVCFTRIAACSGSKYFVEVLAKGGQKYAFDMARNGGSWRVVNAPKVDDFILRMEGQLSHLLQQEVR